MNPPIKGQEAIAVYRCGENDDWVLLKTTVATFELRCGRLQECNEIRSDDLVMNILIYGKIIKSIYTEDYDLFIEFEDGECLEHSDSWISGDGIVDSAVRLHSREEFQTIKKEFESEDPAWREIT